MITKTTPAPMTTVHGFAIQILAFIPIPKDDLKRQIEVSQALIDLGEGTKTVADLVPFMKGIEIRQQHVGKRITVEEANAWRDERKPVDVPAKIEAKDAETSAAVEVLGDGDVDIPDTDLSGFDGDEDEDFVEIPPKVKKAK